MAKNSLSVFEFRCWLDKKFHQGKLDNISRIQHLIDVFEEEDMEQRTYSCGHTGTEIPSFNIPSMEIYYKWRNDMSYEMCLHCFIQKNGSQNNREKSP